MNTMTSRNQYLDIHARGYDCPRCGAWADTPCTTPSGKETQPHSARIDRAVDRHLAAKSA